MRDFLSEVVFAFIKIRGCKNGVVCSKNGAKAPILGGIIEISSQFLVRQFFKLYPIKDFGVGQKKAFKSWESPAGKRNSCLALTRVGRSACAGVGCSSPPPKSSGEGEREKDSEIPKSLRYSRGSHNQRKAVG